jgi:hypothetical protein
MKAVFQYINFEFDRVEEETAWFEVMELDRLEAEEIERKRQEELKEAGEILSESDLKSPTINITKSPVNLKKGGDSDDEPEHRGGPLSVSGGGPTEQMFEDDDDIRSEYSSVKSDQIFDREYQGKITNKINELFSELLILLTHNMNIKDLAFQYEDYDFIA